MITPIKNYPAFLHKAKQQRTLIIADLHLGWETNLARRGIHIPSQMPKIRRKLLHLAEMVKPNSLMILGDVKHTIAKAEHGEWQDVPDFFKTIETQIGKIQIVRGNHDGNLEPLLLPTIKVHPSTGTTLRNIGLFHGHTWPAPKLLACSTIVMGHVHPTVAFRDYLGLRITSPVWIKARLDTEKLADVYLRRKSKEGRNRIAKALKSSDPVESKKLVVMPCFNDFLGGRPINRKTERSSYAGPLLRSDAVNINTAEVYLLDGTFLGRVEQLCTLD
ncbi:MAG: metallophosphoesterase [Candidatus Bathyarchaeota archaeon]|nr:metallophosphoesterase [Candidatus Bathyarchaeota archaeon]